VSENSFPHIEMHTLNMGEIFFSEKIKGVPGIAPERYDFLIF
jgi:hypothetical protein